MSRMTSDLFSITELAHHGPEYLLTAVVTLGGALALMAPICWQLTLVLLLLVLGLNSLSSLISRKIGGKAS